MARAADDGAFIELIRAHMRSDHPDLVDRVSATISQAWIEEDD